MQIGTIPAAKNRVSIHPQVNIDQEDAKIFRELMEQGVDIYCQLVPTDPKSDLKALLEKMCIRDRGIYRAEKWKSEKILYKLHVLLVNFRHF